VGELGSVLEALLRGKLLVEPMIRFVIVAYKSKDTNLAGFIRGCSLKTPRK
jgi:hypothetical protein